MEGPITIAPQARLPAMERSALRLKYFSLMVLWALFAATPSVAGDVWAWGTNRSGQLGTSVNARTDNANFDPIRAEGLPDIIAISAGGSHTLALRSDGTVWAWGANDWEQLGRQNVFPPSPNNYIPAQVQGLTGVVAVAAGLTYSLALKNDGTVWGWGFNDGGQLGATRDDTQFRPQPVGGLAGIVAIAAGGKHILALKNDGTVWACGGNRFGQLGSNTNLGSDARNPTPAQISGITDVTAVSAGAFFSVALRGDGTVWTWGANFDGQLGNGSSDTSPVFRPAQAKNLTGALAISANAGFTLAVKNEGTVWAWGHSSFGELGYYRLPTNIPNQVGGVSGIVAVAAGLEHSLALADDGKIWAWGANFGGALGRRGPTTDATPQTVSLLAGVTAISAGGDFSLALASSSQAMRISPGGVVDAASFRTGVAPGGLASIFGSNLASGTQAAQDIPLPTTLLDTSVTFAGIPGPLYFVSQTQLNVQIPFEVPVGSVEVKVSRPGLAAVSLPVDMKPAAPAIFPGAIFHADDFWVVNSSAPAAPGETVILYTTGLGFVSGAVTGYASPPIEVASRPKVLLGNVSAPIAYAGLAPGMVGVYQVNIQIPESLYLTNQYLDYSSLQLRSGEAVSNSVTVALGVLNRVPVLANCTLTRAPNGGLVLVLLGSGFNPGSVIRFDGKDQPTTYIDRSHLSMTIAGADVVPGSHTLRIFNSPPGGGQSAETVSVTLVYNMAGTWRGFWQSPGGSGSLTVELSELSFGSYKGSLDITGSNVVSQCSLNASNAISSVTLDATCRGYLDLDYSIGFRGTMQSSSSVQGDWGIVAQGQIIDRGTFTATR